MELSTKIMSDIIAHMKYARYLPEKFRRETYEETVNRSRDMMVRKHPHMEELIDEAFSLVHQRKVVPSMRVAQFSGKAIEVNNLRVYNCSYVAMDDVRAFSEFAFLLLCGTGVGVSVQRHHVRQLPPLKGAVVPVGRQHKKRFLISDDIEGWADSVKVLMESHFYGKRQINFDYRSIRPKGAPIKTGGGKAPGPDPLEACLVKIDHILKNAVQQRGEGTQLLPIEAYDICCHIGDMVLAGGQRRSASLSLFSVDDDAMMESKYGNWYETNPQRGRSNNSVVLLRDRVTKEKFDEVWAKIQASGAGEPGIVFSNDRECGVNPSLRAGTKVWTAEGIFPIEELEGKQFMVRNLEGKLSPAKCWKSGENKQLIEITLQGNQKYYATPEHEWPVWDGEKFVKVRSDELEKGMLFSIPKFDMVSNGIKGTYDEGFLVGWQVGDGWTTYRKEGTIQQGMVAPKQDNIVEYLTGILRSIGVGANFSDRGSTYEINTVNNNWTGLLDSFGYTGKERLPTAVWGEASEEFIRGMVDGLFSSDGCVALDGENKRISISSSRKTLLEDLKELLGFYGIRASLYSRKLQGFREGDEKRFASYELRIGGYDSIFHFRKIFKLSVQRKQERLDQYVNSHALVDCGLVRVNSVKLSNVSEDVWDISVFDDTHTFQLSGCITGNCCEISFPGNFGLCNLTEINASDIETQEELELRVRMAARIGTLQASFTDFHYVREEWRETAEEEALIGVSMTGIASGKVLGLDMEAAAKVVEEENIKIAEMIGINSSNRNTCVKPSGTVSLLLGTSSGIHAWYAPYYWRRISVGKEEPIYGYLRDNHPELLEDDFFKPTTMAKIKIPMKAPEGAILRYESALDTLKRVKQVQDEWIKPGHIKGTNRNNVSVTISVKPEEFEEVGEWMWENRDNFTGMSILPYDGGSYVQNPFEECTKEEYEEALKYLREIDLTAVYEENDNTDLQGEAACSGGACEIV